MLAAELAKRQRGSIIAPGKVDDPFVFSPQMVQDLQLMTFARNVLTMIRPRPALATGHGGRPVSYSDATVLVTLLVMMVWQLSPETMVKRLRRWSPLALACGYQAGQIMSSSQLRRRRDRLGLWTYFWTFCALVWVLKTRGLIVGKDWVIDSTIIDAFSPNDAQAGWSFSKRFGYKVHLLLCRDSLLPLMLLLSPANRNDALWAVPLMLLAQRLFGFAVQVVRADAAYFTTPILNFIVTVLRATPKIVVNPRKAGKRFLVTWVWVQQFRRHKGKRGYIERFFAVLKRYFRLNHLQSQGLGRAYQHAFEVVIAALLVAWLADHVGRPDLAHARSRLLAPC
jgi:DDE family transposase